MSITHYPPLDAVPYELLIAQGKIADSEIRHVFGYNPDVDSGVEETVWTAGGVYVHLDTPAIMSVSSTSTSDTSAGVGARQVYIVGINSTGGEVTETVTLDGQTAVSTTHTYTAIQTIQVVSVGSSTYNVGNIFLGTGTVTSGVPANVFGHVLATENQSMMGHFTVPAGYTGYLIKGSISSGTENANSYITGRLKIKTNDIIYTGAIVSFSRGGSAFDFTYPIKITETSCITATATSTGNNEAVSSYFQVLLIKN